MLINKQQVPAFIPQQPPFVMVDALLTSDDEGSTSRLFIDHENIFCKDGVFHEPGLIENIAQTAALAAGYKAARNNVAAEKGFIGAVKRMKIFELPRTGDTLTTRTQILHNVMQATIIYGEIHLNGRLIATCEMTIFAAG